MDDFNNESIEAKKMFSFAKIIFVLIPIFGLLGFGLVGLAIWAVLQIISKL